MIHLVASWQVIGHWLRARVSRCVLAFARWAGIAALLAVYADAPAKESFGRLFFSTEERRTLDEMREDFVEPSHTVDPRGQTVVDPLVDVISFDGKVERSGGGGSTSWVNGRPVLTGSTTVEGISVKSSPGTNGKTVFTLPPSDVGETDFSLKAGQKIAVQSGKVLDSYEVRAAEDAESVFARELPADAAANPDGEKSPGEPGDSGAAKPSPGS